MNSVEDSNNSCSDMSSSSLTERLRRENTDQFLTLVRMHLSFVVDINTDDVDSSTDKPKQFRWGFSKKSKSTPNPATSAANTKCTGENSITDEGISKVYELIDFLVKDENVKQEGIFRRTGSLSRQQELKQLLMSGSSLGLHEGRFSVHDCASVLKSFLAELPQPLLMDQYYQTYCTLAVQYPPNVETSKSRLLTALQLLLLLLSPLHRTLLQQLLNLLRVAASNEASNRMSPDTLATMFTPHLLCPRKSDVISTNYDDNGWPAILCCGPVPDQFYSQIDHLDFTYLHVDSAFQLPPSGDIGYPYLLHTVVLNCLNVTDCSTALRLITKINSWNPEATIIVYIKEADNLSVAQIFYAFWWYQSIHVIIIQYIEKSDSVHIYNYNPYTHSGYQLQTSAKCWSTKRWTPDYYVDISSTARCQLGCGDIPNSTKPLRHHLISCLSFNKRTVNINRIERESILIEDQTANLRGYPLKGFAGQVQPFLLVQFFENGSYLPDGRDGILWNTLAKSMNFTIDLVHLDNYAKPSYITNSKMIFDMSYRKFDLILYPIYQIDLIVTIVQLLFPIRDSGVCIIAHRADFVASWFDTANFNYTILVMSTVCFFTVWCVFAVFKYLENGKVTFDQLGKDFNNTIRNILIMSLYNPPRNRVFRIYLAVSMWSFFLINFATQASIMSFLTVLKRGKEVDTLQDVVERQYPVQGYWSPDMILPDDEEVYRKFTELKVPIQGQFDCVNELKHNPRLCCLMDCTIATYLKFNKLNSQGKPYIHILQDKIHSRFLHMILPHQCPLARRMNKYMMALTEGGLISKFEGYRYKRIHEEALSVNSFSLGDLNGIFQTFMAAQVFNICVFLCELVVGNRCWIRISFKKTFRLISLKLKKKPETMELSTQTEP